MTQPLPPVEAAVRQVERGKKRKKWVRKDPDPRQCPYRGLFCTSGDCPDSKELPCAKDPNAYCFERIEQPPSGPDKKPTYKLWQCKLPYCPCKSSYTDERRDVAYKAWRAKREHRAAVRKHDDELYHRRRTAPKRDEAARELTEAEQEDARWLRYQYIDLHRTMRDIGAEIGLSCGGISKRLKKYGIPARPRNQRGKWQMRQEAAT